MAPPSGYRERIERAEALFERQKARRDRMGPRHRAAVDGVAHALAPGSMDPAIPPRRLLQLDLHGRDPRAAVVLGDLDTAENVTWQLSGSGIRPETAMWGTAREAGQLLLEQQQAGTWAPAVVAWLGYPAPDLPRALFNRTARTAVEVLAHELVRFARLRPDTPHTAIEAHSYGATLAAHVLAALRGGPGSPRIDVLATTGSPGMPRELAEHPALLGIPGDRVFTGLAERDLLARAGRLLSGRLAVAGHEFDVGALRRLGLLPVTGHNTSRFVPSANRAAYGYRDPGTLSLRNLALLTTGREPLRGDG